MNYAINLGFALCFLLTGLVAASLLSTYQNLAGIEISSAEGSQAFAGDKLNFYLRFKNAGKSPRYGIKATTSELIEQNFSVEAEGTLTTELVVTAVRRGTQQLGRITVSSDYPLGLWYGWSYFNTNCKGIVYPEVEAAAPTVPTSAIAFKEHQSQNERPGHDEFSELKSYQPGDPLSRIAWKAVARGQGWYSKAFSDDIGSCKHHFSLEDTRELESIEHQLSRLAAWVVSSDKMNSDYSMALPDYQSAQDRGAEHRKNLLEKLALYGLDDEQ